MKKNLFVLSVLVFFSSFYAQKGRLPLWEKGFLDIHFINTGKGNASFYVLPDGTSMLVDIGDLPSTDSERRSVAIPNDSKTPAQWVADYIRGFHPAGQKAKLDYALISHFHDDHFGHFDSSVEIHIEGKFKLSGITELGTIIPIKLLIDRGFNCPVNFKDIKTQEMLKRNAGTFDLLNDLQEYWKFISYQKKTTGLINEKFDVGSTDQFKLVYHPEDYKEFIIKNLFSNGEISNIWDGSVSIHRFKENEYPGENNLCCGIKVSYGKFDFYTGADIPGINYTGGTDFQSMEALAAPVIGPVDVATLNHHGNRDSQNEYYVRTIRPRVWIGQSWTSNHPGEEVLRRITSKDIYPGERDLFTNYLHQSNITVIGKRAVESYKSISGHIVVRVYPKGEKYDVFILDDKTEQREVIAQYHYNAR